MELGSQDIILTARRFVNVGGEKTSKVIFVVVLGILFKNISTHLVFRPLHKYSFRTSDSLSLVREVCFCL